MSNLISFPKQPVNNFARASAKNPRMVFEDVKRRALQLKEARGCDIGDRVTSRIDNRCGTVIDVELDARFRVHRFLVAYAGGARGFLRPDQLDVIERAGG